LLSLSTSADSTASYSLPSSPSRRSLRETDKIPPKSPAVDAPNKQRPGLVSRASETSTKTIKPRHHLRNKSSSVVPTLSTLNVGTQPKTRPSPTMATHTAGASSGAADLLRQAMMQQR
jgi:protein-serine/threonine kinase